MHTHCSECTWILTVEQFDGLKCPEMLGSSEVCTARESLAVPSFSACTLGFIPIASSSMSAKQCSPSTLLCLLLPCSVVLYLNLLQGLLCTKYAWAGWIGLYVQLNIGHGQKVKKVVQVLLEGLCVERSWCCAFFLLLQKHCKRLEEGYVLQASEVLTDCSLGCFYLAVVQSCFHLSGPLFMPIFHHYFPLLASGGVCCFLPSLSLGGSWSFHLLVQYDVKYVNCLIFCAHALVCWKYTFVRC